MPWEVKRRGSQFCVVVSEGPKKGKTTACHPTEEAARKQVKALYANVAYTPRVTDLLVKLGWPTR